MIVENAPGPDLSLMKKMINMLAHDIKNPLSNILLSAAQFKLDSLPDKEDTSFYIDIIEKNCAKINNLLTVILDSIYMDDPDLQDCNLTSLLEDSLQLEETRLQEKNIILHADIERGIHTRIDTAMIKSVWSCLIDNAVEAMPVGGQLYIHLYRQAECISIVLRDTGAGMVDTLPGQAFMPFFSTKERHKGLGLTYAKNAMETLQGSVRLEQLPGEGLTAILTLPPHS